MPIVVMVSGRGTNLRAILNNIESGRLNAKVRAVVSNRPDAGGIAIAQQAGIPTEVLLRNDFPDRDSFDQALGDRIASYAPGLIVMAGFMHVLNDAFIARFRGRILNIHPSLLPKYRGLHTHTRALEAGDKSHGTTVHFVTEELDGGPGIVQAVIPVRSHDTEASLEARIQQCEYVIYSKVIKWFAAGGLHIENNSAILDGRELTEPVIMQERDLIAGKQQCAESSLV
ncbi:MAG: phosphoribosylglycinamide formyltransferase [Gammaproteobacteria bacterium]|nr:phosphoribosylglycinamide formyltransferase [Gammaproteobacteria bacterium]